MSAKVDMANVNHTGLDRYAHGHGQGHRHRHRFGVLVSLRPFWWTWSINIYILDGGIPGNTYKYNL